MLKGSFRVKRVTLQLSVVYNMIYEFNMKRYILLDNKFCNELIVYNSWNFQETLSH